MPHKLTPFLTRSQVCPFYTSSTQAGKAERWISQDGITIFSYYNAQNAFSISTRFSDGTSIVSIKKMIPSKAKLQLKLTSDFSENWRVHREEVKKRIQSVSALDRGSMEKHVAHEKYVNAFTSTLVIPILIILPVFVTAGLLLLNAYFPDSLDLIRQYLKRP